jgi:2-polyprenyl-3-methyl-5-hydroxy-6-metoxy-1,4-benzoquinol methylase
MNLFSKTQQKFYSNKGNPLVEALVPENIETLLDVGCGAGNIGQNIKRQNAHINIDGITLSQEEASAVSAHYNQVFIHNLENGLPQLIPNERYDCCICSHVLEHIAYPQQLLGDIYRCLKRDGKLIIAVPNLLFYKNRMKLILGKWEYAESGLMDYTHLRWYTKHSMLDLLELFHFKPVSFSADGAFPLAIFRKVLPENFITWIDKKACRIFPSLFGYQFIFQLQK